jgi:hypothetical protein
MAAEAGFWGENGHKTGSALVEMQRQHHQKG